MNRIEVVEYPEPLEGFGADFATTSTGDPEFFYRHAVLDALGPDTGILLMLPGVTALVVNNRLVWVLHSGYGVGPCVTVEDVPTTV